MAAMPTTVSPAPQRRLGQLFTASPAPKKVLSGVLTMLLAFFAWFQKTVWTASRTYDREANSVGREYDAWTQEGILEYYWGEHIHLGYYKKEERDKGYLKSFIQAKYDFIDEMADKERSRVKPEKVLDVGCGIGGTSLSAKSLAKVLQSQASPSQAQVDRATKLAEERTFPMQVQVMDALEMTFPDNTFDVVWACESGEHMPDKKVHRRDDSRAQTRWQDSHCPWCQRDETPETPLITTRGRCLTFCTVSGRPVLHLHQGLQEPHARHGAVRKR